MILERTLVHSLYTLFCFNFRVVLSSPTTEGLIVKHFSREPKLKAKKIYKNLALAKKEVQATGWAVDSALRSAANSGEGRAEILPTTLHQKLGVLCIGVLITTAILFGVYIRARFSLKLLRATVITSSILVSMDPTGAGLRRPSSHYSPGPDQLDRSYVQVLGLEAGSFHTAPIA